MYDFHVGLKVVCINDDWGDPAPYVALQMIMPVKGVIYTLRELDIAQCCPRHGDKLFVCLKEIDNSHLIGRCDPNERPYEPMFGADHFRPLTDAERKAETGMTMLRALQTDWSEPEGDRYDRPNYIPVGEPWPALTPDEPKRKPVKVVIFY